MTDDLDQLLDDAQLPERTVDICLRSDLIEQYKQLASEMSSDSLAAGQSEEMVDLEARIRTATKTFVLRALPREEYRKLLSEHPARKDNPVDRASGLHMEAFIAALVRRCTVSPEMNESRWAKMEKKLSTGQWEKLHAAAHLVNSTEANLPF